MDKIFFLGNSQLITSIVAASCPPEVRDACAMDWRESRISQGSFRSANGRWMNFLACNMDLLGDPSIVAGVLSYSRGFENFLSLVDREVATLFVMLRGNEFGIASLVDTEPGWDFSFRDRPATKGRQFVHRVDIDDYLSRLVSPMLTSCMLIKHKFPATNVVHVMAPPPIHSEEHILKNPEIFGALLLQYGVRPFDLRKKIYEAMYDGLNGRLQALGIRSASAPPDCLTVTGGLDERYAHGCLHGNEAYGRALLGQLEREFLHAPL